MKIDDILTISSNVFLKKISIEDIESIYNYTKKKEFFNAISFNPTYTNTKNFINTLIIDMKLKKRFYWVIKMENETIGTIGLLNFKDDSVEIGFGLSPDYWGKGIINNCLNYLIDYVFNELNFNTIIIGTGINNLRAIKFIKKFDFSIIKQTNKNIYFQRHKYVKR